MTTGLEQKEVSRNMCGKSYKFHLESLSKMNTNILYNCSRMSDKIMFSKYPSKEWGATKEYF